MIVVLCVCRLGEEYRSGVGVYVCGCPGRWTRRMFSAVLLIFFLCFFILFYFLNKDNLTFEGV